MNETYSRAEKIKHKRDIDLLFAKGKWHSCGNLRIITLNIDKWPQENFDLVNQKVGVSVSKRNFKKAVDRNRIKRLLRECYRLNKETFVDTFGVHSFSMLFWISKTLPNNFAEVQEEFINLCQSKK